MIDYSTIGMNIRSLRIEHGFTQETFSEKTDTTPDYISKIENGTKHPSLRMLYTIAEALDVDVSRILTGTDPSRDNYGIPQLFELVNKFEPETKIMMLKVAESIHVIDTTLKKAKKEIN